MVNMRWDIKSSGHEIWHDWKMEKSSRSVDLSKQRKYSKYLLLLSHDIDDLFCKDFSCYIDAAAP